MRVFSFITHHFIMLNWTAKIKFDSTLFFHIRILFLSSVMSISPDSNYFNPLIIHMCFDLFKAHSKSLNVDLMTISSNIAESIA